MKKQETTFKKLINDQLQFAHFQKTRQLVSQRALDDQKETSEDGTAAGQQAKNAEKPPSGPGHN